MEGEAMKCGESERPVHTQAAVSSHWLTVTFQYMAFKATRSRHTRTSLPTVNNSFKTSHVYKELLVS